MPICGNRQGWEYDNIFEIENTSVLSQSAWRVAATVIRIDDNFDLDILITERAWEGEKPPVAGQDIEGCLWLQGYLWRPLGWQEL